VYPFHQVLPQAGSAVDHYDLRNPIVIIFVKLAALIYDFVVPLYHAHLHSASLAVDGYGRGTYIIYLVDRCLIQLLLNDMQAMLSLLLCACGALVPITDHGTPDTLSEPPIRLGVVGAALRVGKLLCGP
jgi:hypothetical protein